VPRHKKGAILVRIESDQVSSAAFRAFHAVTNTTGHLLTRQLLGTVATLVKWTGDGTAPPPEPVVLGPTRNTEDSQWGPFRFWGLLYSIAVPPFIRADALLGASTARKHLARQIESHCYCHLLVPYTSVVGEGPAGYIAGGCFADRRHAP
jgi:hypothetical protein